MKSDLPVLLGGSPIRAAGPPDWPLPDEEVRAALFDCFQSGSWGKYHGGYVTRLEAALAVFHQCPHALTCGSGTFAVEWALRGLKIGPGDEVILAAYDYPGNFLAIHAVGAHPVLVEVAGHNWNLCSERWELAVGPKTRAIIVSHLHGGLVPMRRLMARASTHGLTVLEDAAQCPGALVEGKRAGTWGDVGMLSFGGSKLLSAGRGGAVLTSRADVFQRLRLVQQRGNIVNPLSELQAAVLVPQLGRLEERNAQRLGQVRLLADLLSGLPGIRPFENTCAQSSPAYYKLGLQYNAEQFGLPRPMLLKAMRAEGVALDEGFRAMHLGRSAKRFRRGTELPEAEKAHHGTLVLHHPILLGTASDLAEIRQALDKIRAHVDPLRTFFSA